MKLQVIIQHLYFCMYWILYEYINCHIEKFKNKFSCHWKCIILITCNYRQATAELISDNKIMVCKFIFSNNDELMVSFDGGWQKRGSGRSYSSLSGRSYWMIWDNIFTYYEVRLYAKNHLSDDGKHKWNSYLCSQFLGHATIIGKETGRIV